MTLSPDVTNAFSAPLVLKKAVNINGTGVVYFDGGIQGPYGMTVQSGSINASSIAVKSLTIGVGAAAIPEPPESVLIAVFLFGCGIVANWRRLSDPRGRPAGRR